MRQIISTLFGLTVLSLACAPGALAADMSAPTNAPMIKAPMMQPVFNWSGWYVGGNAGYGFNSSQVNFDPVDAGAVIRTIFVTPQLTDNPKGFLGGLQAGWNMQTGKIVYGVEADFDYAQIKDSATGTASGLITSAQQKIDWFGTLRARLGVTAFDRSLIYATGGLAYGRVSLTTNTTDPFTSCALIAAFCMTGSSQQWKAGWTIGGGWEYAFASNWSAKVEYLYYDLGTISDTNTQVSGLTGITFQGSTDFKGNIVRAGLNYRFH